MNQFIWIKDNSLTEDFCQSVIDRFESDDRTHPGLVGNNKALISTIKQSTDLKISSLPDWKEEDAVFFEELQSAIPEYQQYLNDTVLNTNFVDVFFANKVYDGGYQIQRTKPGEFYIWHHDSTLENGAVRVLTYIWYLNDIHEEGYTEFYDGTKIQPKAGRLILFPATWTYIHRGVSPKSETKYICTGWVYCTHPS
jgi:Rps23 Pro-64 3,4-dihydroxylase Tpa1-like proline 4-hydroxylase